MKAFPDSLEASAGGAGGGGAANAIDIPALIDSHPVSSFQKWILLLVTSMSCILMQAQQPASPLSKKLTISFSGENMTNALQKMEKKAVLLGMLHPCGEGGQHEAFNELRFGGPGGGG